MDFDDFLTRPVSFLITDGKEGEVILECEDELKAMKILVPIDIHRCPLEVFAHLNALARHEEVTVILLHVVNLSDVVPENRVYEELGREAEGCLRGLAHECLQPDVPVLTRVRFGEPAEEIIQAAKTEGADLIVLGSHRPGAGKGSARLWRQLLKSGIFPSTAERVVKEGGCDVLVTHVEMQINCETALGWLAEGPGGLGTRAGCQLKTAF